MYDCADLLCDLIRSTHQLHLVTRREAELTHEENRAEWGTVLIRKIGESYLANGAEGRVAFQDNSRDTLRLIKCRSRDTPAQAHAPYGTLDNSAAMPPTRATSAAPTIKGGEGMSARRDSTPADAITLLDSK